jgi:hypothetical protein
MENLCKNGLFTGNPRVTHSDLRGGVRVGSTKPFVGFGKVYRVFYRVTGEAYTGGGGGSLLFRCGAPVPHLCDE